MVCTPGSVYRGRIVVWAGGALSQGAARLRRQVLLQCDEVGGVGEVADDGLHVLADVEADCAPMGGGVWREEGRGKW